LPHLGEPTAPATISHAPSVLAPEAALQESQEPEQDWLQQTPSAQLPCMHSSARAHAWPLSLR